MSETLIQTLYEVRDRIEQISDERYKYALMYQYLIGGHAAEVSGDYAPIGSDMYEIEYNLSGKNVSTVMFIVKPIKSEEFYRTCVLPVESEYDPWVKQVKEWFKKFPDSYPFRFGKKRTIDPESSKKYLMSEAKKAFSGLKWLKEAYTTSDKQQDRREVDFTSNQLRDLRHDVLKELYGFTEVDLAYFGAWTDPTKNMQMKLAQEKVFESSPKRDDLTKFRRIGETYLEKLLLRYTDLQKIPRSLTYRDHIELSNRFEKSRRIISLIRDINTVAELKLETSLLQESMGLVLDILNECDTEDSLISNITETMTVFEIRLSKLRSLVSDPKDKKSISLLRDYFDENAITYSESMFYTWDHMGLLRNYYDHKRDTDKLKAVLVYFNEPFRMPLNYSGLWNKIVDSFENSLNELLRIVNTLPL